MDRVDCHDCGCGGGAESVQKKSRIILFRRFRVCNIYAGRKPVFYYRHNHGGAAYLLAVRRYRGMRSDGDLLGLRKNRDADTRAVCDVFAYRRICGAHLGTKRGLARRASIAKAAARTSPKQFKTHFKLSRSAQQLRSNRRHHPRSNQRIEKSLAIVDTLPDSDNTATVYSRGRPRLHKQRRPALTK